MNHLSAINVFAALAHDTRLNTYRFLVKKGPNGLPATEISKALQVVPSTLSGHLALLKGAGLLNATRHSREIRYAANTTVMNDLVSFMLSDCCGGEIEHCAEILALLGREPRATRR